jgi:Ca2+-binding EF-hand superfamily protein
LSTGFSQGDPNRQFYLQQFRQLDTAKKGFIDKQMADTSPYFNGLFPLVDRDGDGKMTEKELTMFLDVQGLGVNANTVLTITEMGRNLFDYLDANRDGRLTIREIRTFWEKMTPFDRNKDGFITKDELPREYSVTIHRGRNFNGGRRAVVQPYGMNGVTPVTTKGPMWFRKMDRNGDGDVSPREFLGSMEDFKKIDTNGDGLIDADEATKADKWYREQLAKKQTK